ncbi:MAG: hypothetical protein PHU93_00925, partial [Candidatus Gracilibacteria bacterium]|nr:hypothetical protein [Candidatus Gracilibacteria bacterium]
MPLPESFRSKEQELPPSLNLSEASKYLDSRGISYGEYFPRKRMDMIPHINNQGIAPVLQYLEQDRIPGNREIAVQRLDTMFQQHMKYDAMNYLLGQNIDTRPESYTATIDPKKIGLSQKQLSTVQRQIAQYKKTYPEVAEIPDLEKQMETLEGLTTLLEGPDGIFLSKLLYADTKYVLA